MVAYSPNATKEIGEYQTVTNEIGMDSQFSGGEVLQSNDAMFGDITSSTNAGGLDTQIGSSYDVLKATSQEGEGLQFGQFTSTTKIEGAESFAQNSAEVVDTNIFSTSNSNEFTTTQGADNLGFADSAQSMQANAVTTDFVSSAQTVDTNAMFENTSTNVAFDTNVQTFNETNTTTSTFDNNAQGFDVNAFASGASQENAFQSTNAGIDITSNLQTVDTNSMLNTVEANQFATSSQSFDTLPYIGAADKVPATDSSASVVNTTTTTETTTTNAQFSPDTTATVQSSQVNAYQFGETSNQINTSSSSNEIRTSLVAEKQDLQKVLDTLDNARKSLEQIIKVGESLSLNANNNALQTASTTNFQTTAPSF